MKKTIVTLVFIIGALIITPILVYIVRFHNFPLSADTETWSHFGNYLNGSLTPIIAIVGFLVSIVIHQFSQKNIDKQRMLQRPLAFIRPVDFENNLEIILQNKGIGPMIVTKYRLINNNTKEIYQGIYDSLFGINGKIDFYSGNMDGLVISANEEKKLFQITDNSEDFEKLKTDIRKRFNDLSIHIEYTDIYNEQMPLYIRNLDWYGRHFKEEKQQPTNKA